MHAVRSGKSEIVETILKQKKIDVNAKNNVENTALHIAIGLGRNNFNTFETISKQLLNHGSSNKSKRKTLMSFFFYDFNSESKSILERFT